MVVGPSGPPNAPGKPGKPGKPPGAGKPLPANFDDNFEMKAIIFGFDWYLVKFAGFVEMSWNAAAISGS